MQYLDRNDSHTSLQLKALAVRYIHSYSDIFWIRLDFCKTGSVLVKFQIVRVFLSQVGELYKKWNRIRN